MNLSVMYLVQLPLQTPQIRSKKGGSITQQEPGTTLFPFLLWSVPGLLNIDTFPVFFCLISVAFHPGSTVSAWKGSWQAPLFAFAETSTAAGRGVRNDAGSLGK